VLLYLRCLLVILPALYSMNAEFYDSDGLFTLCVLVQLGIASWTRRMPERWMLIWLVLDIGYGAWVSERYDGLMYAAHMAPMLVYLPEASFRFAWPMALLHAVLLNAAMWDRPLSLIVTANLMFAVIGLLLLQLRRAMRSKAEIELLYDELRLKHIELNEARSQLVEYAQKIEEISQLAERNRISRDIHDELGHKLIRLKMMMEAAVRIWADRPEQGIRMAESVRDQLAESMELLRSTVRKLKPEEGAMRSYSLTRLIEEIGNEQGVDVAYSIEGVPYALYPSLDFILYRNAQEAVTNAIRHGAATAVNITLRYEPNRVLMTVANNGAVPEEDRPWGLGLRGMKERVELVGGELDIRRQPSFAVTTVLPTYRHPA